MTDGRAFIIIPSAIRGHLIETYTCTVCTNPTVQLCFHWRSLKLHKRECLTALRTSVLGILHR